MHRRTLLIIVSSLFALALAVLAVLAFPSSPTHTDFRIKVQTHAGYPASGATVDVYDAKSPGVMIPARRVSHTTANLWGQANIDLSQERQYALSHMTSNASSYNYYAVVYTSTGGFGVWHFSWNYRTNSLSEESQDAIPTLRITMQK